MADEIEQIRRKIDLVEFINAYVPLKKTGRNFKALCPFHSEKTPSFIVSPERQIWHCFGCGLGGDVYGFLMRQEGLEFGEALRELAKRAGVKLKSYQPSASDKQKQLLYEVNHLAAEFFHYLLTSHQAGKKALDYILGRGVSKDSLVRFKLGFAPDMWDGLQKFLVNKKGYRPIELEQAGLIIKRARATQRPFYDRFRARLMFPLKDHRGNICGFAGRVLTSGVKEAKYVNTPETLLYNKSDLLYGLAEAKKAIKKADEVVMVEGELDMISSFQAGVKNVVAIKGSALTPRQVQLLSRFTKNLTLALDTDVAGDLAARRGIELADEAGLSIRVVEIPAPPVGGKDPDEVAQKNPLLWQKLVKKAIPVYDYFLDSACARFDARTAEGKRKIGQELIPVLAKISDSIVQSHYLQVVAEKLAVDSKAVASEVAKFKIRKGAPTDLGSQPMQTEKPSRREILEEYILGLAFQSNHWQILGKREIIALVKTPRFQRILATVAKYRKRYKTQDSERLAKMLAPELKEVFNKFYLLDLSDLTSDEEKFEREFAKALYQLKRINCREKLEEVAEQIRSLEKQKKKKVKDRRKIDRFHRDFRDLSADLAQLEQKE